MLAGLNAWGAPPQEPLYAGLPESLPADYLRKERFVEFEQMFFEFRAPLGSSFAFNGAPVATTDYKKLEEVFVETFLAKLPRGTQITTSRHSQNGKEVWHYPIGTEVVHLIELNSEPRSVFELRVAKRMSETRWAFGTYSPKVLGEVSPTLLLNQYAGAPKDGFTVVRPDRQKIDVTLGRINLQSCRNCHFVNSPSQYQYPSFKEAGPCGFVPANTKVKDGWAGRYQDAHQDAPFED